MTLLTQMVLNPSWGHGHLLPIKTLGVLEITDPQTKDILFDIITKIEEELRRE